MPKIEAGQRSLYFRWTGTETMRKQIKDLAAIAPGAIALALYEEAEELITDIKENHIPVDQGTLKGSGYVVPPKPLPGGGYVVRMGFGGAAAPYAWAVHENPRSGKTGGISPSGRRYKTWAKVGAWKYFERPFLTWSAGLNKRVSSRLGKIWFWKVSKKKG
jgi:hypothetical protein